MFVCAPARHVYCALRLSTCLVIAGFHFGSAGGMASLKHCNEINDPCFCRCDQQTTLSSHSKTKELTEGGKVENTTAKEPLKITMQTFRVFFLYQWGQHTVTKYCCYFTAMLYTSFYSSSISRSQFLPENFCQMLSDSHICVETNCIPQPSESRIHL